MAKICIVPGCNLPVFTHGYCSNHKGLYYKEKIWYKSAGYIIPKKSSTRKDLDIIYNQIREEKEQELRNAKQWKCIFTNKFFDDKDTPDWHHIGGKIGKRAETPLYIYKPWIWPAFRDPHRKYHDLSMEYLMKFYWWNIYKENIKGISEMLYQKLILKEIEYGKENRDSTNSE